MESSAKQNHVYESVFTVTEYYDGPRQGVANYEGRPHFYDCVFEGSEDEYSDQYRLTPIDADTFELALEAWEIWKRWEAAYHSGKTTLESHPALPIDRGRFEEVDQVLRTKLRTEVPSSIIRHGHFEVIGKPDLPKGTVRPLQVLWSES